MLKACKAHRCESQKEGHLGGAGLLQLLLQLGRQRLQLGDLLRGRLALRCAALCRGARLLRLLPELLHCSLQALHLLSPTDMSRVTD